MRRVVSAVPYAVAVQRVLAAFAGRGMFRAAAAAAVIWPDTEFKTAQGAGAAASRILAKMAVAGRARWSRESYNWGWVVW